MGRENKVMVIGLDGADWRLLTPWIEAGHLPTFRKLVSEGVTGPLRSTIRPESSVSWSSFSTGVNPGKHGVFGFVERLENEYAFKLTNGSSVRARRFWDLLGEAGHKVGILNVPITYPPDPVNGFIVSGMLTPGTDVRFAYPEELRRRLLDRFDDYVFEVSDSTHDKGKLQNLVRRYTHQQTETAFLLIDEEPWDLFVVVFTGPDRLQHFLWADADRHHPHHDPALASRFGSAILDHYQTLDRSLAQILDRVPPDTMIFLVSDHGFNGCARRFYVNRWLISQGLLALKSGHRRGFNLSALASRLAPVDWLRRIKRAVLPDEWTSVDLRSRTFAQAVDWTRTRVYFGLDGGLRINLCGREPQGIVAEADVDSLRQELRQALLAAKDPHTGAHPVAQVFLREELYHGPFAATAPDMIIEPVRDHPDPAYNTVLDGAMEAEGDLFGTSAPYSASHTLDGIFVAWGNGVAKGEIEGARIIDLPPTVMAALDVAVPAYMDGRVLPEVFPPERVLPARRSEATSERVDRPAKSVDPAEERMMEERLKRLGYLD